MKSLSGITNILVFDIGAGTTDVSVIQVEDGFVEVLSTEGDSKTGGIDIDKIIKSKIKKIFLIFAFLSLPLYLNALVIGEDGLYEQPWIIETFKDLNEDLEEANQDQKRFMILFEQKGCGYCKRMHEKVYSIREIATTLQDDFFVIRINIFGDLEVTDFDGETMNGSFFMVEADEISEIHQFQQNDPLYHADVWEDIIISPFNKRVDNLSN